MMSKELIRHFNLEPKISGISDFKYKKIEKTFANDYFKFIYKYNLENYPLLSVSGSAIASLPEDNNIPLPAILTLSNLKIIDASDAPWEQIIEFRKDPTAKAKLRKLRLFAYENYEEKSKNYIEDDINSKIYDYEITAKKFGLDLLQATVNNVINSKLFTGVVGGSLLATFFTEPPISLLTASAGIVIELGQLTLEYKRQNMNCKI